MVANPKEYLRASNGDGPAVRAWLSDDREVGDMSVIVDSVLNWPTKFVATIGTLNSDGSVTETTVFLGHLEGSIVMIDEFAPGYFDEGNSEGQVAFIKPASAWADILAEAAEQPSLPAGGTTGQILSKVSNTDGDADWVDNTPPPSGNADLIYNEVPSGTINGSNVTFTLSQTPASLTLYKNGVRMKPAGNDYTLVGNTITFVTAPASGAALLADYTVLDIAMLTGSNSLIDGETPTGLVNGSNTTFTTAQAYVGGSLQVFINGWKQARTDHFVETDPLTGTFTMGDAPLSGDNIRVSYQFAPLATANADTTDGYHVNPTPTANTIPVLDSGAKLPIVAMPTVQYWQGFMGGISPLTASAQTAASQVLPAFDQPMLIEVAAMFEVNYVGTAVEMWCAITQGATQRKTMYHNSVGGDYFQTVSMSMILTTSGSETISFRAGRTSGSGGNVGSRSSYVIKVLGAA